jgi:4-hydroxythreonine-4-phosphate dehydrogenase
MKKIAISIGDLNGIGAQIALLAHDEVCKICEPIYCCDRAMLQKAANILEYRFSLDDFVFEPLDRDFDIKPGMADAQSGEYSFYSFLKALEIVDMKKAQAVVTMPINKLSWNEANMHYSGHTDFLRKFYKSEAIMLMGCDDMYVALFTEHIPYKDVPKHIEEEKLLNFLLKLHDNISTDKIAVLGLNPHASDGGVLGNEEEIIKSAIKKANYQLDKELFIGPIVPDIAFTPKFREEFKYFVCMYHDQGLIPLKALYFDQSINISLGLPIVRTSVDHGTAFDIAYKNSDVSLKSYINAIKKAIELV